MECAARIQRWNLLLLREKHFERRADEEKEKDAATYEHVKATLLAGGEVRPPNEGDLRRWS